jgi:hypothetical protein
MIRITFLLCISFICFGCNKSLNNPQEILNYIGDKNNGLLQEKKNDDLVFKLKYLPPEYFVHMEKVDEENKNRVLKEYQNGISFSLVIVPTEKFGKVLLRGLKNDDELKSRINFLNFQFGTLIEMSDGEKSISPALCILENTYNLNDGLNFLIVFEKDGSNILTKNIDIKFLDLVFDTGIHHFYFNKNDINNVPTIKL